MRTEGEFPRCFGCLHATTGFEPLARIVYQTDKTYRRAANISGKTNKIIECLFWWSIKNSILFQSRETCTFIAGQGRLHSRILLGRCLGKTVGMAVDQLAFIPGKPSRAAGKVSLRYISLYISDA